MSDNLHRKLDELSNENVNIFTGPNNIDKAHIWLYRKCESLFGNQIKLDKNGKSDFNFKKDEFVLASFNSYRGIIRSISDVNKKSNRYNIFKKGKLWSSDEFKYGKNFYSLLNELTNIFGENPVSTISDFNYKSNKKRVVKVCTTNNNGSLYLPDLKYYLNHENEIVKECASKINNYLSNDQMIKLESDFVLDCKSDIKFIKEKSSAVIEILKEDKEIKKVITSFKVIFGFTSQTLDEEKEERIVKSAFVYAYNKFPFDLYLYYPEIIKNNEIKNLSVLMVGKVVGSSISENETESFIELAADIEKVAETESKIVNRMRESIDFQLKWQSEYQKRQPAYDSFRKSVENICKAICNQNNIKAEVTSRLKTFPSFFNKIYNRSSDPKEFIETDNEKHKYKDVVSDLKTTDNYFDMVFKDIRDISGVRIICVYNSDVEELLKLFKKINKTDFDIGKVKLYPYNRIPKPQEGWDIKSNYRGIHFTLTPGKKRLELAEYKNLRDMQCEVQIRTILAHGWSDVQHPMEYKSSIPLKHVDEQIHKEVEEQLNELSKQLRDRDNEIVALKNKVDDISVPMDRYS